MQLQEQVIWWFRKIDIGSDILLNSNAHIEITSKINQATKDLSYKIEAHLKMVIKPKPIWMPWFIYKYLLSKLFELKYLLPTTTNEA